MLTFCAADTRATVIHTLCFDHFCRLRTQAIAAGLLRRRELRGSVEEPGSSPRCSRWDTWTRSSASAGKPVRATVADGSTTDAQFLGRPRSAGFLVRPGVEPRLRRGGP